MTGGITYNCPMDSQSEMLSVKRRRVFPAAFWCQIWLAALLGSANGFAATVYKSVDENGVVTYSDTKPAREVEVETLVIDVQDPALTETEQQRLQDMRDTTDRMVADRQQREKHRAEMREQQAQTQSAAPNYPGYVIESGSYPLYYPYRVRRPGWNKPRPDHPVARPPMRPPRPGLPPRPVPYSSSGHDYPASLVRKGYSPEVRAAFQRK